MARAKRICCECKIALKKEEVALSKKLIDVDTEDFYCLDCLADYLECSTEDLKSRFENLKNKVVVCSYKSEVFKSESCRRGKSTRIFL